MKKLLLCAVLFVSGVLLTSCSNNELSEQKHEVTNMVLPDKETLREFIVEEPEIITDVVYDEEKQLKLDIYTQSGGEAAPAVILLHGGGLTSGDKKTDGLTGSISRDLARTGYVVFNLNYTLSEKADINAMEAACFDVKKAFDWVVENSEQYGVDNRYIAIGGYSSGATIAMNVCYSNTDRYSIDTSRVFAVIDIAGGKLTFGYPEEGNPTCLILHGDKDSTVKYSDSEAFVKMLEKEKVPNYLHKFEGLNHIFTTRYEEVINQIARFLYTNLTGKEADFTLKIEINPEWLNVENRQNTAQTYYAGQVECTVDGNLDEWKELEWIELEQIKDAGAVLPDAQDFSGRVCIGWNEKSSGVIYIAASITDETIVNAVAADGKWYNDDCLEIVYDLSMNNTAEQLMKWVIGAEGDDLSVLATKDNTEVAVVKNGSSRNYEIAINLNKVDTTVRLQKELFSIEKGMMIGFSICYNDAENKVREHQIGWTSGKSSDRTTLGNIVFK